MLNKKIIFFDGVCHLCNGFVDYLIQADSKKPSRHFYFAPLQGTTAQILSKHDRESLSSVIYFDQGVLYRESDAVLKIFSDMGGIHIFWVALRLVPLFIRNFIYRRIAKNRYAWFGEHDFCRIPQAHEKEYLLP